MTLAQLTSAPESLDFLKSLGFSETDDGHFELPLGTPGIDAALAPVEAAVACLSVPAPVPSTTSRPVADPTAGMSLKQKAHYQQEQKAKADREIAKQVRQAELEKIEQVTIAGHFNAGHFKHQNNRCSLLVQDKMVRARDENWSAQAAGVKGGKPIETFRGKFGEESGAGS